MNKPFIFFGTPELAVHTLDELKQHGLMPAHIVTAPDAPVGRGQVLTKSPVHLWGLEHSIPVHTPEKVRNNEAIHELAQQYEYALLAAYGKIIPQSLLDSFPKGIINIHPSLLPKYRGPSPLEAQILADEKEFGVTLIRLDAGCDTGPVIAQRELLFPDIPSKRELGERSFREGARLFSQYLGPYLSGVLHTIAQTDSPTPHTKKIQKQDGELLPTDTEREKYLKYKAYDGWPQTFFFYLHGISKIRLKVTQASFQNDTFIIEKVIPEGKQEMFYSDFVRGLK